LAPARGLDSAPREPLAAFFLLSLFGARSHQRRLSMGVPESGIRRTLKLAYARISPSVTVYSVSKITLADYAIVSQGSTLCAASHDIEDPHFQTTAPSIMIGARAWVAAEAFVGPGSPSAKAQSSGREDARFAISNLGRFMPAIPHAGSNCARFAFSTMLMPSLRCRMALAQGFDGCTASNSRV
jgi:hypothetical protein